MFKKIVITIGILLMLCGAANAWNISDADVAQWKLNDNAANTDVADASGNGHGGTCSVNTSTAHATGKLDGALDFNGDRYVTIGDDNAFSFGNGTSDSPFSVVAWVYVTDTASVQVVISKYDATTGNNQKEWLLDFNTEENLIFLVADQTNSVISYVTTDAALSSGWRLIVATYDGEGGATAADGIEIYVDGLSVNVSVTNDASYVAMSNTSASVLLGAYTGAAQLSSYFADKLDNIVIVDRVITEAEVKALWNGGNGIEDLKGGDFMTTNTKYWGA